MLHPTKYWKGGILVEFLVRAFMIHTGLLGYIFAIEEFDCFYSTNKQGIWAPKVHLKLSDFRDFQVLANFAELNHCNNFTLHKNYKK